MALLSHLGEIFGWTFLETGATAALELGGIALVVLGARRVVRAEMDPQRANVRQSA